MMEIQIKDQNELRSSVAKLNADVIAVCNAKTIDEMATHFVEAKDLLIAVYKYSAEKLVKETNQ